MVLIWLLLFVFHYPHVVGGDNELFTAPVTTMSFIQLDLRFPLWCVQEWASNSTRLVREPFNNQTPVL